MKRPVKLLLIEDNEGDRYLIKEMLSEEGYGAFDLACASSLREGLEYLENGDFEGILLDLFLPDSSGIETVVRVKAQAPEVPVVVLTSLDDEIVALQAVKEGAHDFLFKGLIDHNLLVRSVLYALERKRAEDAQQKARELEACIQERTVELIHAYEALQNEMVERRKIEKVLRRSEQEVGGLSSGSSQRWEEI
jgi:CheY-like chemotaxis protein